MPIPMGIPQTFIDALWKKRNRWMFDIPGLSHSGNPVIPQFKGSRPSVQFNEIKVNHLNEYIYFPGKADWKTINLVFYDIKLTDDPVFDWLKQAYDPQNGGWETSANKVFFGFKREVYLSLYDGCGVAIERWILENAYPSQIDWTELDMMVSDVATISIVLRYDRAYKVNSEC